MRLGAYPCVLVAGHRRGRRVRHDGDQRAAPPPLRVRERLPRRAVSGGSGAERHVARQATRRDGRAARPPVLRRAASSTRSSRAGPRRRIRSSRASFARRSSVRRHAREPRAESCPRARASSIEVVLILGRLRSDAQRPARVVDHGERQAEAPHAVVGSLERGPDVRERADRRLDPGQDQAHVR